MKSVLISIKPKYCELIANGEKTIEVRKTRPKLETPFKCYIYMSQGDLKDLGSYSEWIYKNRMKVIGEFICEKIVENFKYLVTPKGLECACLSEQEVCEYLGFNGGYGWHISDLKIYEKPKELSEFYTIDESGSDCCCGCVWHETPLEEMPCRTCTGERKYLYRPPQSWCYVRDL